MDGQYYMNRMSMVTYIATALIAKQYIPNYLRGEFL